MLILTAYSDRVQRLKEARTQASKEIDEYRQSKEKEFKAFEAGVRYLWFSPVLCLIVAISNSTLEASKQSKLPLTRRQKSSVRRSLNNTRQTRTRSSRNCSTVSSLSSQSFIATSRSSTELDWNGYSHYCKLRTFHTTSLCTSA